MDEAKRERINELWSCEMWEMPAHAYALIHLTAGVVVSDPEYNARDAVAFATKLWWEIADAIDPGDDENAGNETGTASRTKGLPVRDS